MHLQKFTKLKKKTTWNHAYYIQSITDNLRARYWNMDLEINGGNKLGARRAEQIPTLEIIL